MLLYIKRIIGGEFYMALKLQSTIILFFILLPVGVYTLSSVAFDFFMCLAIIYVCIKSLRKLFIYNFASDEILDKYEASIKPLTKDDILARRTINISATILFTVFFAGKYFCLTGIIKYAALIAAALWLFDLIKIIHTYIAKPDFSEDYTVFDTVLEILMWIQNILSVVITLFLIFN